MNAKRAQLTLFVLLGIVFAISVLFLLFVASSVKEQTAKETETSAAHTETYLVIKSLIQSCLEKSTKDGLTKIGLHGGYLPLLRREDATLLFFNNPVAYGLREPPYSPTYPPAPVPAYPYAGRLDKMDFPYYGRDQLHGLCDPSGPNRLNATAFYRPCESYEIATSLQQQLTAYVVNQTITCINFTSLPGEAHAIAPLLANITIGNTDVTSSMEYPIAFATADKKRQTDLFTSSIKVPVRLKAIHEFAKALIKQDSVNPYFDPLKDGSSLPEFKGGFVLHKVQNACPTCKGQVFDDILALSDTLSNLDGKPYLFQFSRENRIPALEWIHETGPTFFEYDILVEENNELKLHPSGIDPDEEAPVHYSYGFWQEDYAEHFDENCPYLRTNPQQCVQRRPETVRNWTQSALYQQTLRNASIFMTHTDIGRHVVRVSVSDRQNMTDYQDVTVFVRDKPYFNLTGKSIYHDLPPNLASIEDPFVLEAIVRCIFWDCGKEFEWRLFSQFGQQPYQVYKTDRPQFIMPPNPSIATIRLQPFTAAGDRVKFKGGQFEFDFDKLKVFQCLPHWDANASQTGVQNYDPSNPDANPPYPFTKGDSFYAPHVCCEGDPYEGQKVAMGQRVENWGSYSPPSKVCYGTQKLICSPNLPGFDSSKAVHAVQVDVSGAVNPFSQQPTMTVNSPTPQDENDIYELSFAQRCSGNRGNICGGLADYTITFKEACRDDLAQGQTERCFGPAGVTKDNCFDKGTSGCFPYKPGDTLEKTFMKDPTATGFCNTNLRPASARGAPNTYDTNTGNEFLVCKARCDGAGGCTYADECQCTTIECNGVAPGTVDTRDGRFCTDQCQKS
ncbi:hypothetical protein HY639_04140 [Candidatus Woesearchaeota archaeon]|nr:hypothetical protein [Candidatus Woesearchaeota archaeon]